MVRDIMVQQRRGSSGESIEDLKKRFQFMGQKVVQVSR